MGELYGMKRAAYSGFLITLLLISSSVFATHNRAGEITWVHIVDLTYEFTITTYTDPNSPADRASLGIDWGDGTADTLLRSSITGLTDAIQKNEYIGRHTYSGPATFVVSMVDPNRVEGVLNIDGSVNVPFCLVDTIVIYDPLTLGYNSSPVLLNPPIDFANIGQLFVHNPNAYDPEGDSLHFELVVPMQYPGIDVPGYLYPEDRTDCPAGIDDVFTINPETGEIVWDVPVCDIGYYNIAINITEYRNGIRMGSILRDMQIYVDQNLNHAPVIADLNDTCVFAGEELNLLITGTDPDATQTLTMTAEGGPFFITNSPAEFFSTPDEGFVEGTFIWNTNCDHVRDQFYQVVFKVEDDFQIGPEELPLADLETWLIYVVAPPVQNVEAEATANEITVTWDEPYTCESAANFLGFSIWRKIGCDSIEFDKCQRGLGGTGYDSIGFVEDAYTFMDDAVIYGQEYAYRVIAEFGEHSEVAPDFVFNQVASAPSNSACAELKRDLPIINHASVRTTSATNGSIYVGWYKPSGVDLDTTIFLPPYKYEVYRSEGFEPTGTETLIATFTAPTFAALNDTSVIDTLINTLSSAWNYRIKFYFTNLGSFDFLGQTEAASSVFLNASPGDNKLNLTWDFNVPWLNFKYDVYKETPTGSGDFEFLTTTTDPAYTDLQLVNGEEYCYYVKAYGQYTIESLPDTLINFSQIRCAVPIDNEPPCAPVLTVQNVCQEDGVIIVDENDLKNDLVWTNPNHSCADDVISYQIFYASLEGQQLTLLDIVQPGDDTTFTHDNLQSIAGCYAVVAVDSFNNQSVFSNIVCVDNCSDYVLPNTFTPNGDGFNDLFTPILPYRFIDHVDMKIFDRWGNPVFETTDPLLSWDGRDANTGKDAAEGVYYYVCNVFEITIGGVRPFPEAKKGYIHLIREDKTN